MRYSDYLDDSPPPIGPFKGDRRMDQVEAQRGNVYPQYTAPGMICYEDGSCVTVEEANRRAGHQIIIPVRHPRTDKPDRDRGLAGMLANRMTGRDERTYHQTNTPEPGPAPAPMNTRVVCFGQNCYHVPIDWGK